MATETSKTTSPGNAPPTPQQIPLAQIRDLPGIVNIRTYTPKDLGGLVSSIHGVVHFKCSRKIPKNLLN